jgi:hypothetical protein
MFLCILGVCDAAVCAQEREERKRARDAGGGGGEEGGRGSRRRMGGDKVLDTGRGRAPGAAVMAKLGNTAFKGEDVPPSKQAPVRNEKSASGQYERPVCSLPPEKRYPNGKTDEQLFEMSCEEVVAWLAMPGLNMNQKVLDRVRTCGIDGNQIIDMSLDELEKECFMELPQAKRLDKNRLSRS